LERYFLVIDPTSLNKQGEDEGTSYRTGIYWVDDPDESVVLTALEEESKKYDKPLVVEHEVLKCYYPAEEYHQKYLVKNPDGYCHIGGCFFENK
ncbi:MAG: peptide-methionine (S)-S-oxide reductase, partial [Erysipelotrichaceae bacterium]|nr:peptide-methionine (S)-S-oxide reductase [Erysipelotrichaceae bacterium]